MAFFELNSEIAIGNFKFTGVHDVKIKRSIHSHADTAYIKVPSIAAIVKGKGALPKELTLGTLFNEGDKVIIKLGYNGNLKTEFEGFVRRLDLAMPLGIDCEGYVRKLRQDVDKSEHYDSVSLAKLLGVIKEAVPEINVIVKDEMTLHGLTLTHANGEDIVKKIKELSQGTMSIFFITPNTLWCGLTYTPYSRNEDPFELGTVNYRLGYNVVKDNSLKERVVEGEPVQIIFHGTLPTGQKITTASQAKYAKNKQQTLVNNLRDEDTLKVLANEKQMQANYAGYDGNINAFLSPFCLPGWIADIADERYPERNGKYLVESTEVSFGLNGARRTVEIGPKIGFNPNPKGI